MTAVDRAERPHSAVRPRLAARDVSIVRALRRLSLYLMVALGSVAFVFPLYWLVSTSLKPESEVFLLPPRLAGSHLEWENYAQALSKFPFLLGLRNTMIIVCGVELGRLVSAPLAAYTFARLRFPFSNVLFMLVLSTMMLPYQVLMIPQYLLFRSFDWLNTFLPLIVPSFFGGGAFYIFLLRQFFLSIPREYDDAAEIDGCNPLQTYWRVILPMSLPAIGAVAIFTFMGEWNDYFGPLVYLNETHNYPLALHFKVWEVIANSGTANWQQKAPFNQLLAVATLVTVIPLVVFFFTQRYFLQGVVISGVKG